MGFFESFSSAYNAVEGIKSSMQSKDILKEASAGGGQPIGYASQQSPSDAGPSTTATPVVPDTPDTSPAGFNDTVSTTQDAEDMAAGKTPKADVKAPTGFDKQDTNQQLIDTYTRAAQIALNKGNASLAQDFSKKAEDVQRAQSVRQLESLKASEKALDVLGQMVPAASTKEDIIKIIGDTIPNPQTAMVLAGAIKNAPTLEEAKNIMGNIGLTMKERLDSEYKATQGEVNQYKAETDRARVGLQAKREARLASGQDTVNTGGEKINKEYRTQSNKLDIEESKRLAMIDSNPYVADKDAAKASIRDEFQTKRDSLDKRYGSKDKPKADKKPKFEEGKIYQDAAGNKAKYVNGQWQAL